MSLDEMIFGYTSCCKRMYYEKRIQIVKPMLLPATIEGSLLQDYEEKTGYEFIRLKPNFCPICGKALTNGNNKR